MEQAFTPKIRRSGLLKHVIRVQIDPTSLDSEGVKISVQGLIDCQPPRWSLERLYFWYTFNPISRDLVMLIGPGGFQSEQQKFL
jgi:hypothetical protein